MLISSSVLSWLFSLSYLPRLMFLSDGCHCLFVFPFVFRGFPVLLFGLLHLIITSVFFFQIQSQLGPLLERLPLLCLVDLDLFIGVCVLRLFRGLLLLLRPVLFLLLPLAISSGILYSFLSFLLFLTFHTDLSQVLPVAWVPVFSGIHRGHSAFNLSHQSIFINFF